MANNPELVKALSSLPDDVKARLSKGTPEQKKIFIDGLAKRLELQSDVSSQSLEKKPTFGSELGRVALQGASGLAFDIPNIGRKPISEIVGGQPLSYMNRAARLAQDPRAAFGSFLTSGPQGFADRLNNVRESTPADFGFPVLPEPQTKLGKAAGMVANLGGQLISGNLLGKVLTPRPVLGPNLPSQEYLEDSLSALKSKKTSLSGAESKFKEFERGIKAEEAFNLRKLRNEKLSGIGDDFIKLDDSAQKLSASKADIGREKYWESYKELLKNFENDLNKSGFKNKEIASKDASEMLQSIADELSLTESNADSFGSDGRQLLNKIKTLNESQTSGSDTVDAITNKFVSRATETKIKATDLWNFLKKETSNDFSNPIVNRLYKHLADKFPEFSKVRAKYKPDYQDINEIRKIFDLKTASKSGDVNINKPFDFLYKGARNKFDESDLRIVRAIERQFGKDFMKEVFNHSKDFENISSGKKSVIESYAKDVARIKNNSALRQADFQSRINNELQKIAPDESSKTKLLEFVKNRSGEVELKKQAFNKKLSDANRIAQIIGIGGGGLAALMHFSKKR